MSSLYHSNMPQSMSADLSTSKYPLVLDNSIDLDEVVAKEIEYRESFRLHFLFALSRSSNSCIIKFLNDLFDEYLT